MQAGVGCVQEKIRLHNGSLILYTKPVDSGEVEGEDLMPPAPKNVGGPNTGIQDLKEEGTRLSTANFVFQNFPGVVTHILQYCSVRDIVHVALTSATLRWILEALMDREVCSSPYSHAFGSKCHVYSISA